MFNGAVPAFAPEGGALFALVRALSVAALISCAGTLVFARLVLPRAAPAMGGALQAVQRRLTVLAGLSGTAGLVILALWLWLQTAAMADTATLRGTLAALPEVATDTRFGHVVLAQMASLLLCLLALRRGPGRAATLAAVAALLLQAGHSHALAMDDGPSLLVAAEPLHLLGAGVWLGGLLPLAIVVWLAPPAAGVLACRWFSPLGQWCMALVAGSALVQGWVLVGSVPGLVGTAYGWMAMVKLALFGVLAGFAWVNRYRLAPRLRASAAARPALLISLGLQTLAGLAVVTAAAVLSSLSPAMHVQPLWPFTEQLSLEAVQMDPDLRAEALGGAALLAGSLALLAVAAALRHRLRWLALLAAPVLAWLALPHLDLLFVPAYPTSFYRSPTGFAADSILAGAALYPQHCASCHGAGGHGDGTLAAGLPEPPADLTAPHLWAHADGELFWWLSHGMTAPDGSLAMPGFAATVSEDDRWALIDFIRARNAGLVAHATGDWSPPLPAPDAAITCSDGDKMLSDLHGGFVRLVFGTAAAVTGVTTVTAGAAGPPAPGLCIADDAAIGQAYAIIAGGPVAGMQFLIDGDGWLRAMRPPATAAGWGDPTVLGAELRELATHPVAAAAGMGRMAM